MGEVEGYWPDLQADYTLAQGAGPSHDGQLIFEIDMTRSELIGEIARLVEMVNSLTTDLKAERSRPDAENLLNAHRREVEDRMAEVIEEVQTRLTSLAGFESKVDERLGAVERQVSSGVASQDLHEIERRLRHEVSKVQASQFELAHQVEEVVDHVVDLRASEVEFYAQTGRDAQEFAEVESRLRAEVAKLQNGQQNLIEQVIDLRSVQTEINSRYGNGAQELLEAENRLRAEVAKLQAGQQSVMEQVVDLRSARTHDGDGLHEVERRLRAEVAKLHAGQQDVAAQVLELRGSQEHLMADVVDLRALQDEIGSRQMATIVENGRLRDELLREAERLRAVVEESRETANKAMFRADASADNNDALQAEFDENVVVAERRLAMLESLITQVDQRLEASHSQVAELAAAAVTQAKASEIAARAHAQSGRPVDHELFAHIDARVAAGLESTGERLAHVEASTIEQSRQGVAATDAVASRLRHLEVRLNEFEARNAARESENPQHDEAPMGWQFERRSRLKDLDPRS